jgi:hypothetical protein
MDGQIDAVYGRKKGSVGWYGLNLKDPVRT